MPLGVNHPHQDLPHNGFYAGAYEHLQCLVIPVAQLAEDFHFLVVARVERIYHGGWYDVEPLAVGNLRLVVVASSGLIK